MNPGEARENASLRHYRVFYALAHASEAHSRFCKRVYGQDLCQDGQTDLDCFHEILERLKLKPGAHVLDLGCGAGGLAEYLAERTGARVTGVDNSPSAIETANTRTEAKRDRFTFIRADMNALDFPAGSFDAALAIDSISWVTDTVAALSSVANAVKPGGQLCILTEQRRRADDLPDVLEADRTPVARALRALNLKYETIDYTPSLLKFWSLARQTAERLREDFIRDGAGSICETWIKYADEIYLPAIQENRIRRYLYHAYVIT